MNSYNRASTTIKHCIKHPIDAVFLIRNRLRIAAIVATHGRFAATPDDTDSQIKAISILESQSTWVRILNDFQPNILVLYPSVLSSLLADQALYIKPSIIFSIAEPFSDKLRNQTKRRWGSTVYEVYGCSESLCIALRENNGMLKIRHDLVIVQTPQEAHAEDADQSSARDIIITNLFNKVMPLIRYRVGDQVIVDRMAQDRRAYTLKKIYGRSGERGVPVKSKHANHVEYIATCAIGDFYVPGAYRFQFVSESLGEIIIRYEGDPSVADTVRQAFLELIEPKADMASNTLHVEHHHRIPPEPSGKTKLLVLGKHLSQEISVYENDVKS